MTNIGLVVICINIRIVRQTMPLGPKMRRYKPLACRRLTGLVLNIIGRDRSLVCRNKAFFHTKLLGMLGGNNDVLYGEVDPPDSLCPSARGSTV